MDYSFVNSAHVLTCTASVLLKTTSVMTERPRDSVRSPSSFLPCPSFGIHFCSAVFLHLQKNVRERPVSGHPFPAMFPHAIRSHQPAASVQTRELALAWFHQPLSRLWITMLGRLTVLLSSRIQAHTHTNVSLGKMPLDLLAG